MRIIEVFPNLHLRSCTKAIVGMRQALAQAYLLQALPFFVHSAKIDVAISFAGIAWHILPSGCTMICMRVWNGERRTRARLAKSVQLRCGSHSGNGHTPTNATGGGYYRQRRCQRILKVLCDG